MSPRRSRSGFGTLVIILAIERFAPDSIRRVSVLLGLIIGTLISIPFGLPNWDAVGENAWVGIPSRSSSVCPSSSSAPSSR